MVQAVGLTLGGSDLARPAGGDGSCPYDLRSSANAQVPTTVLGHSNLSLTAGRGFHWEERMARAAAVGSAGVHGAAPSLRVVSVDEGSFEGADSTWATLRLRTAAVPAALHYTVLRRTTTEVNVW